METRKEGDAVGIVDSPVQRVHVPLVAALAGHQADLLGDDLVTGEETLDFAERSMSRIGGPLR